MTEYRTTVSTETRPSPQTAPSVPDRPAVPDRASLWRRLAEAVTAGHRSDVPF